MLFASFYGTEGIVPIRGNHSHTISDIDEDKVSLLADVLSSRDISTLNKWIDDCDLSLTDKLLEIQAKLIKAKYRSSESVKVYRGFGNTPDPQDSMGILVPGPYTDRLKDGYVVGSTFSYTNGKPLSMARDKLIADTYGRWVVSTEVKLNDPKVFEFTDDIYVLLQRTKGMTSFSSQTEVLLIASKKRTFKIESW